MAAGLALAGTVRPALAEAPAFPCGTVTGTFRSNPASPAIRDGLTREFTMEVGGRPPTADVDVIVELEASRTGDIEQFSTRPFRELSPQQPLARLIGKPPSGTWRLKVTDAIVNGSSTRLASWSLVLTGRAVRVALLITTWVYVLLNFAFFDYPWPWAAWTIRTLHALVFFACAIVVTWHATRGTAGLGRPDARPSAIGLPTLEDRRGEGAT